MKAIVIGANSRLARAFVMASAKTGIEVVRVQRREADRSALGRVEVVASYDRLPGSLFAGVTSIVNCVGRPVAAPGSSLKEVNSDIPVSVARQGLDHGVRHFVQVSSLSVFGRATHVDHTTPLRPTTLYGQTKLEAEQRLLAMRNNGLELALVRVPMIYGPGVSSKLENLARLADLLGWLPAVTSRPKRSFAHIDNAAAALVFIVSGNVAGSFFATDREPFEVEVLAAACATAGRRRPRIVRIPDIALLPLRICAPPLHGSLFESSVVVENANLCQAIEIPKSLMAGLVEVVESLAPWRS